MRPPTAALAGAFLVAATVACVGTAQSDVWLTAAYTANRVNGVTISANTFPVLLAQDVGGSNWAAIMRIQNVTVSPSMVRFTLAAAPASFDILKARIANLTSVTLRSLGVSSISENVASPPPRGTNPWIVGVVFGGLAAAAAAVGFAEWTARGARARRRARQNQPSMNAGMLTDN